MSVERDVMEYDVVVVGAGPAGLAAAIRLKQKAERAGQALSVCVVEKGSEVGAHILSGAVFEPRALAELIPDWKEKGAPLITEVLRDEVYFFGEKRAFRMPNAFVPKTMHNRGNYIISLGKLVRWLGSQAEALGVEIYPGFAAQEVVIEDGVVRGVQIGDMGMGGGKRGRLRGLLRGNPFGGMNPAELEAMMQGGDAAVPAGRALPVPPRGVSAGAPNALPPKRSNAKKARKKARGRH